MKLPPALKAYFDADADTDGSAPTGAFTTDAIVKDEGKTHVGHKAIAEWWRAYKAQYKAISQPREISGEVPRFTVLADVSGKFTGSPISLNFTFTLNGNAISSLEIGA